MRLAQGQAVLGHVDDGFRAAGTAAHARSTSRYDRQHFDAVTGQDQFILGDQFAIADDEMRIKRDLEHFDGLDDRQIGADGMFFSAVFNDGGGFGHDG